MKSNFEKVLEFHWAFGCLQNHVPTLLTGQQQELRETLMREELRETIEAMNEGDIRKIAKELADLLYVVYGTADAYGINIDRVFEEVHASNMSKLLENGQVLRREDGKVLKGPKYFEPNLDWIKVPECNL